MFEILLFPGAFVTDWGVKIILRFKSITQLSKII